MLTYGSVCSGIEAATVAWDTLGMRPAWFAEIEDFPARVLAHHYPAVANLGDMTQIAMLVRAGFVDAPDVLVGGTPCQAFSVAGMRAGLADPRGQLTLAYADLANAIDERRPGDECVVVWENVPGVLSSADNAFGCFLGLLAGEDSELTPEPKPSDGKNSKYWKWDKDEKRHTCRWSNVGVVYGPQRTIAWRVLDAQYFGVAQRRRRVFVVASARKGFDPAAILFESDGVRRDTAPSRETAQDVAGTLTAGARKSDRGDGERGYLQPVEVSNAEGATGLPFLTASNIGKTVNNQTPLLYAAAVSPTLRAGGNSTGGDRPPGTDVDTCDSLLAYAFQPRIARNGRGDMGDVINALTAQAGETGKGDAAPCVAISFDCKASGLAGFGVGEIASTMRSMGHANSHQNGGGHLAVCVTGDVTHTLKAEGFDASEDGTGRGQPIVAASREVAQCLTSNYGKQLDNSDTNLGPNVAIVGSAVRRLTPRECERLQGFPDDYTLVPVRGKMAADGPRYKALGNSMAVPCMRWIGERIKKYLR